MEIEKKQSESREQLKFLRFLILIIALVLIFNLGQNYFTDYQTFGDQSPIIKGDSTHIQYNNR